MLEMDRNRFEGSGRELLENEDVLRCIWAGEPQLPEIVTK